MEKDKHYHAIIEEQRKPYKWEDENNELHWIKIGTFSNEKEAQIACKLYIVASNDKVNKSYDNSNCTGKYVVINELSLPKRLSPGPVYESLDNFIKGNLKTALYKNHIGEETMKKLLKEIGEETEQEKNLRIIERMIKEYNDKLHFALRTSSTSEESIEKIEESIKYLESLRDKTTGFTK